MQRYEHGGDIYAHEAVRLDFSVNINPLGMPVPVREAIAQHVDDYQSYPDPNCRALCEAIAQHEHLDKEDVLCGNGAADLIFRLCFAMRPKRALVCAPTFSEYEKAVLLSGGELVYHALDAQNGFRVTEAILGALKPEIDLAFLCTPNNPTGALMDPELLARIAQQCSKNDTLLMVDECFLPFTNGRSIKPLLREHHNLMILKAFTKLYAMAGVRLGYLLSCNHALLEATKSFAQSWSVSTPAAVAGVAALGCEDWVARTKRLVETERAYLHEQLAARGMIVYESEANFLLFQSEVPLYHALLKRGILIRPCDNYTGLDERFYRIGVKKHEENAALIHSLDEVLYG